MMEKIEDEGRWDKELCLPPDAVCFLHEQGLLEFLKQAALSIAEIIAHDNVAGKCPMHGNTREIVRD